MGQYDDVVERQRILLEAEEWAKQPKSVHVHGVTSMWYETEESIKDFENGNVTDTHYYGGHVVRQQNGKVIRCGVKKPAICKNAFLKFRLPACKCWNRL